MTYNQKAKDILNKIDVFVNGTGYGYQLAYVNGIAQLCCEQIIKAIEDEEHNYSQSIDHTLSLSYWENVQNEIKKLK